MPQNIGNFIQNFHGGTRPNRYLMTGNIPIAGRDMSAISTHIWASTMPDSTISILTIPYRGRMYKFPGDRAYQEWTFTLLDDVGENHAWEDFHQWSEAFNAHGTNLAMSRAHAGMYCNDLTISHIDHNTADDTSLKSIKFHYAWPVSVGPVTLDMNAANQLSTYQITIAFTGYEVLYDGGAAGVAGANDTGSDS
jgi:hypothetical protein